MVHVAHMQIQRKKVTKERELWLSARIQDCKVVTTQETASATCYLKIHWQDKDFLKKVRDEKLLPEEAASREDMKLEKMAVDLEKGNTVYSMVDAVPDSFPINIDLIFKNQISSERIASLCWTSYDKDKGVFSVSGWAVEPKLDIAEPFRTFCAFVSRARRCRSWSTSRSVFQWT